MQHWSKLEKNVGDSWPMGRQSHAAACVGYGGDHPQLIVTGGYVDGETLSDCWILNVEFRVWKEVSVCEF